jgi:hypothetical protein
VTVLVYALAHCVAEFLVAFKLFGGGAVGGTVLLYNACAFLAPALIGFATDARPRSDRLGAVGCLVLAGGLALASGPASAAVMGAGNAALHVAGGREALRREHKSSAVGWFLAPGGIGLALGVAAGRAGAVWSPWLALAALGLVAAVAVFGHAAPAAIRDHGLQALGPALGVVSLLVGFALVRTVVGGVTPAAWKTGLGLTLAAALAQAVGKAGGGPLGDRFGAWPVLCLSALGAAVVAGVPGAVGGLIGIVFLNLSVAPLLGRLAQLAPGREGFVLGVGQATQFPLALLGGATWGSGWVVVGLAAMVALAAASAVADSLGRGPRAARLR